MDRTLMPYSFYPFVLLPEDENHPQISKKPDFSVQLTERNGPLLGLDDL